MKPLSYFFPKMNNSEMLKYNSKKKKHKKVKNEDASIYTYLYLRLTVKTVQLENSKRDEVCK